MDGRTPKKLYMQIADDMRRMIEQGLFQPGEKLPTLQALAAQFGCSRATVREALGALRGQGLVEFRHGNGTYVRTASVEMWMQPLDAAILLGLDEVRDLVELQTAVLAGIAHAAAKRRGGSDYSALARALFELESSGRHSEHRIASELHFYSVLAECAANRVLENAFRVLQEALRSSLRVLNPKLDLGLRTCRSIYDAVQMERPDLAREVVYAYGEELLRAIQLKKRTPKSAF
ncbi:GntR family transcriptional regulator [Alicyclobacillus hesperidum subsp. aegles]|uniref:FadR/GntR family transcriptional regulator n=1 Tax=Alicyclobacillus hesperidum TaxID=89784 RepID=UPI000AFAF8EC|nr:GntR family transcriptional regulator [Alicyclobacillus hesperidum]GLG01337.1 GntR family transcriptional regulator [Alicyclobacillus hesperidum subsp. aegles]